MADEENEKIRTLELQGQVGLDALPNQLMKTTQNKSYTFNILCVGTTGIGKSTLLNNLFFKDLEKEEEGSHDYGETRLITKTHQLEEGKMKLNLTVVETVGFGDQLSHEESSDPILEYIDAQFKRFLDEELKIKRSLWTLHDSRIHACLYFISPNGHSLKALDLVTMKKLDSKVNLIPLIAKADSLTRNELVNFKIKVMSELVSNGVQFYPCPTVDEDIAEINSSLNAQLPFAVIGSNEDITVGNKTVKGRMYPWGSIQVENENHSDLVKLRQMLLQVNMEDLRDQTHERHYELYRRCKLEEMGFKDPSCDNQSFSLQKTYEAKRKEFLKELQHKEESMRQMFVNKVKEAEVELKEKEKELQGRFEHLKTMHQEEKKNLEEKKREMEEEMNAFNRRKVAAETLMGQAVQGSSQHPFKKDKDKKNFFSLPSACSLTSGRNLN